MRSFYLLLLRNEEKFNLLFIMIKYAVNFLGIGLLSANIATVWSCAKQSTGINRGKETTVVNGSTGIVPQQRSSNSTTHSLPVTDQAQAAQQQLGLIDDAIECVDNYKSPQQLLETSCDEKTILAWINEHVSSAERTQTMSYPVDTLLNSDIQQDEKFVQELQQQHNMLLNKGGGRLGTGWTKLDGSERSLVATYDQKPESVFKFCIGSPGRGDLACHFTRVPKGRQMQKIIMNNRLHLLHIPKQVLFSLKSADELLSMDCDAWCYYFVVQSDQLALISKEETISELKQRPLEAQRSFAHQLSKLIIKSGIGDSDFVNMRFDKNKDRLMLIDTEPIYGSLALDFSSYRFFSPSSHQVIGREEAKRVGMAASRIADQAQLNHSDRIHERRVQLGLEELIRCMKAADLPVMQQVVELYLKCYTATAK